MNMARVVYDFQPPNIENRDRKEARSKSKSKSKSKSMIQFDDVMFESRLDAIVREKV